MTQARWYNKANAYAEAWKQIFGSYPPRCAVVLGLAVAEHETRCGDAWPGECNWGAVQQRALNVQERAALSGITPNSKNVTAARDALAAAGLENPGGALHADYSPAKGAYYFVWFAQFSDDTAGAKHFVHVLAEQRKACSVVLRDPVATEYMLAERMYQSHYFEGFRNPKALYEKTGGSWHIVQSTDPVNGQRALGSELNILDYAGALHGLTPSIGDALKTWMPGDKAPPLDDLATILGQQRALNRHGATLTEDGVMGPKTKAAIVAFQKAQGLTPDGIIGPKTKAALAAP